MTLSRYKVGYDGKTAYGRRKGRKCNLEAVPIGEKVWYKQIRKNKWRKHRMESEENEGIWLGHARTSNEVLIGTPEGVVRAYSISRKPEDQQWDGPTILAITGTPAQPDPSKDGIEIPIRIRFDTAEEGEVIETRQKEEEIRRMRITQEVLGKYG